MFFFLKMLEIIFLNEIHFSWYNEILDAFPCIERIINNFYTVNETTFLWFEH